jgi:predicted S18 family serine protease
MFQITESLDEFGLPEAKSSKTILTTSQKKILNVTKIEFVARPLKGTGEVEFKIKPEILERAKTFEIKNPGEKWEALEQAEYWLSYVRVHELPIFIAKDGAILPNSDFSEYLDVYIDGKKLETGRDKVYIDEFLEFEYSGGEVSEIEDAVYSDI